MTFIEMRTLLQKHFEEMTSTADALFRTNVDKDVLWNLYLDSFDQDKNQIYRTRRYYDCSCCRQFIKNIGNVVSIRNGKIITIWDFSIDDDTYAKPVKALGDMVRSADILDAFFTSDVQIGTERNFEKGETAVKQWDHFMLRMSDKYIVRRGSHKSVAESIGNFRDTRNVFKRSLDEISADSVETVLELIAQKSLYRGEEWEAALKHFLEYKKEYDILGDRQKSLFAWEYSKSAGPVVGRIRNHSIGTLLANISEGMELDTAVSKYEAIVAPSNYKRPKAIYTKKMLDSAKEDLDRMGYLSSLGRRYATIDDISVSNIIFSNKDAAKKTGGDIFDEMASEVAVDPKKFSKVEEIGIEDFIKKIVPTATSLDILLENRLSSNMVSLIAPEDKDSKTMFKWDNNFCWAYAGNITDSMKERVKAAGGDVTGDIRFSIQWNESGTDNCDLDAHCLIQKAYDTGDILIKQDEIFYGHKHNLLTDGQLDIDIIHPNGQIAVENITFPNRRRFKQIAPVVTLSFFVNQYSGSARNGFRAEIEFDGNVYSYDYDKPIKPNENVKVATVACVGETLSIIEHMNSSTKSKDVWNLKTNQFVPVTTVMYSPNYWDYQHGVGNKHYFFMLKDCINPENPNGFYNEFLNNELDKHKHVMEALGGKLAVKGADEQLSGIGFSSTKRNSVIVKVKGAFERMLKVNF